ncbi:unnamed protein product, partial [Polarella glacialis]
EVPSQTTSDQSQAPAAAGVAVSRAPPGLVEPTACSRSTLSTQPTACSRSTLSTQPLLGTAAPTVPAAFAVGATRKATLQGAHDFTQSSHAWSSPPTLSAVVPPTLAYAGSPWVPRQAVDFVPPFPENLVTNYFPGVVVPGAPFLQLPDYLGAFSRDVVLALRCQPPQPLLPAQQWNIAWAAAVAAAEGMARAAVPAPPALVEAQQGRCINNPPQPVLATQPRAARTVEPDPSTPQTVHANRASKTVTPDKSEKQDARRALAATWKKELLALSADEHVMASDVKLAGIEAKLDRLLHMLEETEEAPNGFYLPTDLLSDMDSPTGSRASGARTQTLI